MDAFRQGLMLPGMPDIRSSVLDDLSVFYQIDAEEALYRCTHSFELNDTEWKSRPRITASDRSDFYDRLQAWSFGLLWYAYLQAEGLAPPVAVIIANDMKDLPPNRRVLDFGSGVGTAAAMFEGLGHPTTLSDISSPLLEFAAFRLKRRGFSVEALNLNETAVPADSFDVVAAIQTLASVPDIPAVARQLHRCLVPGGLMYADIDVQSRTGSDSRMYDDDLPSRRSLHTVGFEQKASLDGVTIRYRRVGTTRASTSHRIRGAIAYGPVRRCWRKLRYR